MFYTRSLLYSVDDHAWYDHSENFQKIEPGNWTEGQEKLCKPTYTYPISEHPEAIAAAFLPCCILQGDAIRMG